MKLREADAFYTAMKESPAGDTERFAFVMETKDTKVYFFVDRETVSDIVTNLVEMVGYDA